MAFRRVLKKLQEDDPRTTWVDFCRAGLGDRGAITLAEALKINTHVTRVDLEDNNIGPEGARALANALLQNTSVTSLDLLRNNVGVTGCQALSDSLLQNATLTFLGLEDNDIGGTGARHLADALRHNTTLQRLEVMHDDLGDEGCCALADVIGSENRSLRVLSLSSNKIGDEGALAIAAALRKNRSITEIHLGVNRITDEGAKALLEALKGNLSITELRLQYNSITSKSILKDVEQVLQDEKRKAQKDDEIPQLPRVLSEGSVLRSRGESPLLSRQSSHTLEPPTWDQHQVIDVIQTVEEGSMVNLPDPEVEATRAALAVLVDRYEQMCEELGRATMTLLDDVRADYAKDEEAHAAALRKDLKDGIEMLRQERLRFDQWMEEERKSLQAEIQVQRERAEQLLKAEMERKREILAEEIQHDHIQQRQRMQKILQAQMEEEYNGFSANLRTEREEKMHELQNDLEKMKQDAEREVRVERASLEAAKESFMRTTERDKGVSQMMASQLIQLVNKMQARAKELENEMTAGVQTCLREEIRTSLERDLNMQKAMLEEREAKRVWPARTQGRGNE